MHEPERLPSLKQAMDLIAEAVERLPEQCRDVASNALLNIAAETVADDVGCTEAGRIFSRLGDLLYPRPPPADEQGGSSLSGFDA